MVKRALTAKQLAADRRNLAKARAVLKMRKPQTAAQMAVSRRNATLSRTSARSARSIVRAVTSARVSSAGMVKHAVAGRAPLGSRHVTDTLTVSMAHRKPTGINPRFKKRIAPTIYDERGKWQLSRAHHFKKRLHMRKAKKRRLKNWRIRHGRIYAR